MYPPKEYLLFLDIFFSICVCVSARENQYLQFNILKNRLRVTKSRLILRKRQSAGGFAMYFQQRNRYIMFEEYGYIRVCSLAYKMDRIMHASSVVHPKFITILRNERASCTRIPRTPRICAYSRIVSFHSMGRSSDVLRNNEKILKSLLIRESLPGKKLNIDRRKK